MGILHLSVLKDCTRKDVCIALYVIASSPPPQIWGSFGSFTPTSSFREIPETQRSRGT